MSSRVAIVTGGGNGIGAQVGRTLAAQGMTVVLADIKEQAAQQVASELGAPHDWAYVDVVNEQSVWDLFQRVETEIAPVSVLVCAAGLLIMPGGSRPLIKDTTLEIWEKSYDVNATGAFLCSREFLRRRIAQPLDNGRVVFFSSVAAQLGGYRSSASYIAAKSAVLGYAKAFAREAAEYEITANTIAPGLIDTDMLRDTVQSSGSLAAASRSIPLQRLGTAAEVASTVGFLASEQAAYITGSVIDVNGGYRMQ